MSARDQTGSSGQVRDLLEQQVARMIRRIADAQAQGEDRATRYLRQVLAQAEDALSWSPEERQRRALLQALEVRLATLGPDRLSWQLRTIEPFGVTGCVITARGIAGGAQVLIVATDAARTGAKRHYVAFPPLGEVCYELRITAGPADGWASRPLVHRRSPDAEAIAAAIVAWRDATPLPPAATPPLTEADLAPLRARAAVERNLAGALRGGAGWEELGLRCTLDRHNPPAELTAEAAAQLAVDLAAISPGRLLANVPRDARGHLALEATVALASYATVAPQPQGRQYWLVARTPARRRDPQVVTLALTSLIGQDQRHRWDQARWLWIDDDADETARWGVAGLDPAQLGLAGLAERIARLREARERGELAAADRVALCILLQDEGELVEACAACGVAIGDEVAAILTGGQGQHLNDSQAEHWPTALQAALRAAAPWRFAALLAAEEARLAAWVAAKAGRRRKPARLRLLALPKQISISKASLMLARATPGGAPRLELEWTGSTATEPEVRWRRAAELDLRRFGLLPS